MSGPKAKTSTEAIKGSVKEAIGKLIGDGKVEAEGKAQQNSPTSAAKSKTTAKP